MIGTTDLGTLRHDATDGERVAILHIGTHRTGTTSFQRWASTHRHELSHATGLDYDGVLGPNHAEIPMLCLRTNRSMRMRARLPDWCLDEWQRKARAHIRDQCARPSRALLASAEGLSYIRHRDEVERLVELLSPRRIALVVALRERSSFLRSYRQALAKAGFPASPHRESFAYVADDSWLVDYGALLRVYRGALGAERVVAIDYERALQRDGSIIPGILDACGADRSKAPSWNGYWCNSILGRRGLVHRIPRPTGAS